jgi:hypothetical protein
MTTPAKRYARSLIADLGSTEARRIATQRRDEAGSDVSTRNFWIEVMEALR